MAVLKTQTKSAIETYPALKTCRGRFFKWRVFVVAYLGYACLHSLRSSWGSVKPHVGDDLHWDTSFLGTLDFIFLMVYGIGIMFWGAIGDKSNKRYSLCIGMSIAFCGYIVIAITGWTQVLNQAIMIIAFSVSGIGESAAWPSHIPILGAWFAGSHLKTIMGFYSTCPAVGDIVGQQISGRLYDPNVNTSWTRPILVCACFMIVCIILMFCFEYQNPKEAKFQEVENKETLSNTVVEVKDEVVPKKSVCRKIKDTIKHFFGVWKLPGLPIYILCFAIAKALVYGIAFWLPTILENIIGFDAKSQVPWLQLCFTLGQLLGAATVGLIADQLKSRALVIPFYFIAGIAVFIVLGTLTKGGFALFAVFLFLAGICLGAPCNYIIACVAAELGTCEDKDSASAIPGMKDGFGSIFAAIVSKLIPYFEEEFFWVYAGFCLVGGLLILPLAYKDLKTIRQRKKSQKLQAVICKEISNPESKQTNLGELRVSDSVPIAINQELKDLSNQDIPITTLHGKESENTKSEAISMKSLSFVIKPN